VLARAYPEATAGEPVSWSWDKAAKRFDFTYRPNPTIAKPTVVSLPVSRHYRNGYKVTVTGGSRVSAPGSASLELQPAAGSKEVRVTVLPG